jgi:multiple sugar transport system permease protein
VTKAVGPRSPYARSIVAHRAGSLLASAVLVVACSIAIVPLLFMAGASLMPGRDVTTIPYRWIPERPLWSNYLKALEGSDRSWIYLRNILNSFIVATSVATSSVFLASFTGYGLAKYKFRGRNLVFMGIMATMMIPFEAVMIPLYLTAVKLGLQDSYAGLILPFLTSAFGVFLMRQYLLGFPDELLDAARIDGCSEMRIYRSIVFKNAGPAVATLAILAFRGQWDNLLWPLLITQSEKLKTIPSYIVRYTADLTADEGTMMAVAVIAALPVFCLFFTMSKYFLRGAGVYSGSKS